MSGLPSFWVAESIAEGLGMGWPSRSAVASKSVTVSRRLPGLPSAILSARGFFFAPAPTRAPPRLVPSFAMKPPPFWRGVYTPFETAILRK